VEHPTPVDTLPRPAQRVAARIDRLTVVPISIGLIVLVGFFDFITGQESTFTLLYVLPVALGAWHRGRRFGIGLAVLTTLTQACSSRHDHTLIAVWNAIGSFGVFVFIVWLVTVLHAYVVRERGRLDLAVSQLRHAERLNVIGTLAAGVAHEIGTPLNVITLSSQRLADRQLAPSRVDELIGKICGQAAKISAIVRHLLEFGRRASSERTEIEVGELARRTVELVSSAAGRYHCAIEVSDEPDVRVSANAAELEQVLSNLLLNAMQAMPQGGTVRVTTGRVMRRVADGAERPFASLAVADEGTGIEEADLPHIFDPFFTTKPSGEGTGLGLSVSYGIITDLGGAIEVQSQRGGGSTFTVLLPALG
jgi:signal transduction histidine kinase